LCWQRERVNEKIPNGNQATRRSATARVGSWEIGAIGPIEIERGYHKTKTKRETRQINTPLADNYRHAGSRDYNEIIWEAMERRAASCGHTQTAYTPTSAEFSN